MRLLRCTLPFLPAALVGLPALAILWGISHTADLPDLDYWYALERLTTAEGVRFDSSVWTLHSNEHLVPLTGLLYTLNAILLHGSSTGLSLIAWSMGLLQCLALISMLPQSMTRTAAQRCVSWSLVAIFTFTPAAYHNWLRGMSGTSWISANAFSTLALLCFVRFHGQSKGTQSIWLLWASAGSAVCASLFYSTGLMSWPMLGVGALHMARRDLRPLAIFCGTGVVVAAAVVLTFEPSLKHAPPGSGSMLSDLLFFLSLLGGLLSVRVSSTIVWGGVGILALGTLTWCAARIRALREEALPWLLLSIYPLCNGVVSAVFRAADKFEAASHSRYASLPGIFWLSVSILLLLAAAPKFPRLAQGILSPAVLLLSISPWVIFHGEYRGELARQRSKALAALSLQMETPDWGLVKRVTISDQDRFAALLPRLKLMKHVPFRPTECQCSLPPFVTSSRVDTPPSLTVAPLPPPLATPTSTTTLSPASLRSIELIEPGLYRASGLYRPPPRHTSSCRKSEVVLIANGRIVGLALVEAAPEGRVRWDGYLVTSSLPNTLQLAHQLNLAAPLQPTYAMSPLIQPDNSTIVPTRACAPSDFDIFSVPLPLPAESH